MINTVTADDLNFFVKGGEQPELIVFGLQHKPRVGP